jgi:hypothetical protein
MAPPEEKNAAAILSRYLGESSDGILKAPRMRGLSLLLTEEKDSGRGVTYPFPCRRPCPAFRLACQLRHLSFRGDR